MNQNDLEKFRRHVGQSKKYMIGTEGQQDEFEFEPLETKYLPDYLFIMDAMTKKEISAEETKEAFKITISLITHMLYKKYPELDTDIAQSFITNNYFKLQEILFDLNKDVGFSQISPEILNKVEELKKKVKPNEN